jgi:sulfur relay (sulfurtransferase) complex TusBCD TusD component (DsrE family)
MNQNTVILFTRFGMGDAQAELQQTLVTKYFNLILDSGRLPAKMLFYTDGVKLACTGSPVLEQLRSFESKGVELVLCQTCLNYLKLTDHVQVGIVGGMGDILEALQQADKVISV